MGAVFYIQSLSLKKKKYYVAVLVKLMYCVNQIISCCILFSIIKLKFYERRKDLTWKNLNIKIRFNVNCA